MRFQPGQQVVCIRSRDWVDEDKSGPQYGPEYNEIVTVHGYHEDGSNFIILVEYRYDIRDGEQTSYAEDSFAPLQDITELTEILERQTIEV